MRKKKKEMRFSQEKKQSVENNPKMTEMLEFTHKVFQSRYRKYSQLQMSSWNNEGEI